MRVNKKIIVIVFLLIAGGSSLFVYGLFNKRIKLPIINAVEKTAVLKLDSSTTKAIVGKQFTLFLYLINTSTNVSSFDAVIAYDPEMVQVDEIHESDMFPFYPRKMIEDFKSRFVVTGVQQNLKSELKVKSGELAQITVTPLRTGRVEFQFLVDGDKYTNVMNRALENVLQKAVGITIEINP